MKERVAVGVRFQVHDQLDFIIPQEVRVGQAITDDAILFAKDIVVSEGFFFVALNDAFLAEADLYGFPNPGIFVASQRKKDRDFFVTTWHVLPPQNNLEWTQSFDAFCLKLGQSMLDDPAVTVEQIKALRRGSFWPATNVGLSSALDQRIQESLLL